MMNNRRIKLQRVSVIGILKTARSLQILLLNLRQELSTAAGLAAGSPDCSDQLLNSAAGGPVLLGHNEDNSGDLLNASYFIHGDMVRVLPVLIRSVQTYVQGLHNTRASARLLCVCDGHLRSKEVFICASDIFSACL